MRRPLLFLCLAVLVCGPGCVRLHVDVEITGDGSGAAEIEFQAGRAVADALLELQELHPDDHEVPRLAALTRDRLEAHARQAGVKLRSWRHGDDTTGVSLQLGVAFDDVASYSRFLNAASGAAPSAVRSELRILRGEGGNLVLTTVEASGPQGEAEDRSAADGRGLRQRSLPHTRVLIEHLAALDVRLSYTVPGEVISSNAMEVQGRTSIWVVHAANVMDTSEMPVDPHIVFAGEGLSLVPDRRRGN